jgi:hypothetical protein
MINITHGGSPVGQRHEGKSKVLREKKRDSKNSPSGCSFIKENMEIILADNIPSQSVSVDG